MKKPNNYESTARFSGDYEQLPAGGYVVQILNVEDVEAKEYLKIEYDIFEGEHKGYYDRAFERTSLWFGTMYISYKDTATSSLKAFIEDVEASNKGFTFDWNHPEKLVKRGLGLVLQEEEYESNKGDVRVRLIKQETKTCAQIRAGDFKVKSRKTLNGSKPTPASNNSQSTIFNIQEDDIQF